MPEALRILTVPYMLPGVLTSAARLQSAIDGDLICYRAAHALVYANGDRMWMWLLKLNGG